MHFPLRMDARLGSAMGASDGAAAVATEAMAQTGPQRRARGVIPGGTGMVTGGVRPRPAPPRPAEDSPPAPLEPPRQASQAAAASGSGARTAGVTWTRPPRAERKPEGEDEQKDALRGQPSENRWGHVRSLLCLTRGGQGRVGAREAVASSRVLCTDAGPLVTPAEESRQSSRTAGGRNRESASSQGGAGAQDKRGGYGD